MDQGGLVAPSFFICPISLQIMKDPVTICTGITFDRESIETWLFSYNKVVCPVTKQPLSDFLLIPNSNLLRLIQSWHLQQESLSKFVPNARQDHSVPLNIILEEIKQPHLQVRALRKIRSFFSENDGNRTCRGDDDLFPLVASLVLVETEFPDIWEPSESTSIVIEEAVSVLCLLGPSDGTLKMVSENRNGLLIRSLCSILTRYPCNQTRIQALNLLKSIFNVVNGIYMVVLKPEFFESTSEILKDQSSKQSSIAVLSILIDVLPFGRNKEKAIRGGFVPVIVELLAENNEKRMCEMMLVVLENLCRKAEGRSSFLEHPMSLAAVLSKILRVSKVGNDKAVTLFLWIFRFCKSTEVAREFMEMGGMTRMCLVVQSGGNSKIKDKAREVLRFHLKAWSKSPCFHPSYIDYKMSDSM
ncbi:hypothetical protein K2173_003420 [Erythroxylum novogranatense]|uniref:U-box domain-containing protein n=1 Tax=Erythroxylum novogranatense TaxID=1862640 RepID=A0AAV8S8J8_9ROSI|nr:hypothetical protein K2173_003420 [Erythroxylum novogranatense]